MEAVLQLSPRSTCSSVHVGGRVPATHGHRQLVRDRSNAARRGLVDVFDFFGLAAERLLRQRGFHELIDITVEHGAGI
jgi:hypothetical protein